jgi:RNase H
MSGLKTWIYRWKQNGFRNAQGETVKNAGIIRCTSIQLDIRARYPQRIRLQYVKGHSGDIGNDGADAMANGGTLLPAVEERDWAALERKLSEQLEQGSVETSDIEPQPLPLEVQDTDDVENTEEEIPSSKMRKTSSGFDHEHKGPTVSKSKADIETIRNKKISLKVIFALPPFVPVKEEEVNFDVSARLGFARQLFLTFQQDYADCLLDDEDLQLSD